MTDLDPTNLIDLWCDHHRETPDTSIAQRLREINAALGTRHTHSTLSRWRTGTRGLPANVHRIMLADVIDYLAMEGSALWHTAMDPIGWRDYVSDQDIQRAVDLMMPPAPR